MKEKKKIATTYIETTRGYAKARDKAAVEAFCKSSELFQRLQKSANSGESKADKQKFLHFLSEADNFSEMLELIKAMEEQPLVDKAEKAPVSPGFFSSLMGFFPLMASPDLDLDLDKAFWNDLPCLVREIANYAKDNYFVVDNDLKPYIEAHQLPENKSQTP